MITPILILKIFYCRCGSTDKNSNYSEVSNVIEGRKLDLAKDQNDISHNEIDDSLLSAISKPGKIVIKILSKILSSFE